MADAIALEGIEYQNLIRFGDGLAAPEVSNEYAPIRKHQVRALRAFLGALVAAPASTNDIAYHDTPGTQEVVAREFRHRSGLLRHLDLCWYRGHSGGRTVGRRRFHQAAQPITGQSDFLD